MTDNHTTQQLTTGRKRLDWVEIRSIYETEQVGYRELAKRFRVSPSTICRHAQAEGWLAGKTQAHQAMTLAAVQAASEAGREMGLSAARLEEKSLLVCERLIDQILAALDGPIADATKLRALSSAFKEAVSVGRATHRMDEKQPERPRVRPELIAAMVLKLEAQQGATAEVVDVVAEPVSGGDPAQL